MKKFQDLYIQLNGFDIETLVSLFTEQCNCQWKRAFERERDYISSGGSGYFFEHMEGDGLKSAGLTLLERNQDVWFVPNIVPMKSGQLSVDEYNELLRSFYSSIIKPAVLGLPVSVELTKDHVFIDEIVDSGIADALKRFSVLANKSTGSSHPLDRKRWFDFLILVNNSGVQLCSDLLIWTLRDQGWSEDSAHELAIEFEFAQELLNHAKGE